MEEKTEFLSPATMAILRVFADLNLTPNESLQALGVVAVMTIVSQTQDRQHAEHAREMMDVGMRKNLNLFESMGMLRGPAETVH